MIEQFKSWGADIIELAVHEPTKIDVPSLNKALESAGMENNPVCGMFPPDRDLRGTVEQQENSLSYLKELVDLAAAIGSDKVAGPMFSSVGRCNLHTEAEKSQQSDLIASNLAKACAYAESKNVTLMMEPLNRFETDCINTLQQGKAMIDKVGSPALKMLIDTFHMHIEESDSAQAILDVGAAYIGHLHACGNHRGIPGQDQVHWKPIFSALKAIGYAGDMSMETFAPDNEIIARATSIWFSRFDSPEQFATEGLSFLRKTWEEVS